MRDGHWDEGNVSAWDDEAMSSAVEAKVWADFVDAAIRWAEVI